LNIKIVGVDIMNPETEGKILVTLIISLIAFACGSGAGIVMGISKNDQIPALQINQPQKDILIPYNTPKEVNTQPKQPNTSTNTAKPQQNNNNDTNVVSIDNTENQNPTNTEIQSNQNKTQ
jgi:flagellar basal body-associated protein FliL